LVAKSRFIGRPIEVSADVPGLKYPVHVRLRTTDVSLLSDILLKCEYDWELSTPPRVIVDAGANVGMASVYFANKYPEARIIAIEPEASNYRLLKKNTANYSNVTCVEAALWKSDTSVTLGDPGGGDWSFQTFGDTKLGRASRRQAVEGITVQTVMERFGIDHIDFFKVDIEGAEKEVFEGTPSWADKIGLLAIELHDWAKIGCSRAVYLATKDFEWEFRRGETVYFGRGEQVAGRSLQSVIAAAPPRKVSPKLSCRIVLVA
jgi:FkbM family methyltransferase